MNKSPTRQECEDSTKRFSKIILDSPPQNTELLYVGTAGDPVGGEYSPMFKPHFNTRTFDADPKWNPDLVGDITSCPEIPDGSYGVIVCVQVLEHVPNLWDVPKEMHRLLCDGGYAIVDTPFMYPYHAEPPSFGDYWRLTKDGMKVLFSPLFEIVELTYSQNLTSALIRKKQKI